MLAKGPNRVGLSLSLALSLSLSLPPHLKTETDPVSETLCFLSYLEVQTMDAVHKPSDAECYTPSSEPFRLYSI
jgi:hypothetical protein